ncbi:putative glutathione-dependent formaldehyde-activating enzyme [Shimia sp. SK013]|uniref:GFA family protein n=1 Tax=Shimia sp. SK013 TaxID=1389006 RepID=UPI0006B45759|nr:GFA family protein [Shimia sp. SK013]KPA23132.1 putative glutathione-dependent formaldehyde-activating enzyme [Shimia sp. SK013]
MSHKLTCHCGAVELHVTLSQELETARRCDCSFCRRRGAAAVSAPLDGLKIVKGADNLTLYQFNTNTAQHYFCKTCGIYTHHKRRSNPNEYGVNLGALEGVNPRDLGQIGWVDGVNHPSDRST